MAVAHVTAMAVTAAMAAIAMARHVMTSKRWTPVPLKNKAQSKLPWTTLWPPPLLMTRRKKLHVAATSVQQLLRLKQPL